MSNQKIYLYVNEGNLIIAISDLEDALIHKDDGVKFFENIIATKPFIPEMILNQSENNNGFVFTRDQLAFWDYYAVSLILLFVYVNLGEGQNDELAQIMVMVYLYEYQEYKKIISVDKRPLFFNKKPPESIELATEMFNTNKVSNVNLYNQLFKKILTKIEDL